MGLLRYVSHVVVLMTVVCLILCSVCSWFGSEKEGPQGPPGPAGLGYSPMQIAKGRWYECIQTGENVSLG